MNSNNVNNNSDTNYNFYNPSLNNQVEKQEIGAFNYLNAVKMFLSKSDNISLLYSMTKCWCSAQATMIESKLLSRPELMQKAQIKLATGVEHRFYKILKTFGEMTYGEGNVLVTTRNIGSKEVLRSEEDKNEYIELRHLISQKVKANDLVSLIGCDESYLVEKFKNNLDNFEPKSAKLEGVCFSACMHILGKVLDEPEINEEILVRHVEELHKGVPAKVAAIQQIYQDLEFTNQPERITSETSPNVKTIFCNNFVSIIYKRALSQGFNLNDQHLKDVKNVVSNAVRALEEKQYPTIDQNLLFQSLCKDNFRSYTRGLPIYEAAYKNVDPILKSTIEVALKGGNNSAAIKMVDKAVANLYGYKEDGEGTAEARQYLDSDMDHPSSKQHIQNLMAFKPGSYQLSFKTMDSGHSVLYVKNENGAGYLIDPNYGLIKCDSQDHRRTILKMLSLYPPPNRKLEHENSDRNYGLVFTKYIKPVDINTLPPSSYTDDFSIGNQENQEIVEPKILVSNFLDSIKTISNEAKIFVIVKTTNKVPQIIEYSFFDNPFFPNTLFGTRLDTTSVSIDVSKIQGLEVVPQLGDILPTSEKEALKKIGIIFNKDGFINIPKEMYDTEKTMKNNVIKLRVVSKNGDEVVTIETKICADRNTCDVHWIGN